MHCFPLHNKGGAKSRRRLDAMLEVARQDNNGVVMNNLVPLEMIDPRTVSSADKWNPVTKDHFCDPASNGSMVYAGHCVCATDASSQLPAGEGAHCYGNFKMNQQNGGKVFATQTTVFEAGQSVVLKTPHHTAPAFSSTVHSSGRMPCTPPLPPGTPPPQRLCLC